MTRFLVVTDTPGIKQFVFGTDALAEVRGASALLDRLNRFETEDCLSRAPEVRITKVFAAGGTGQFIVQAPDRAHVQRALDQLAAYYHEQTGGEMWPLAGVAEWAADDETDYRAAVRAAFDDLHLQRSLASSRPTVPTLPFVVECQSTSHLPAAGVYRWGDEQLLLSRASQLKREESRQARRHGLWSDWMKALDPNGHFLDRANDLRYPDAEGIGEHSSGRRKGYIGLIYADGNAMGRLVQELNRPEVCTAFSELVDGSVRDGCYEALSGRGPPGLIGCSDGVGRPGRRHRALACHRWTAPPRTAEIAARGGSPTATPGELQRGSVSCLALIHRPRQWDRPRPQPRLLPACHSNRAAPNRGRESSRRELR